MLLRRLRRPFEPGRQAKPDKPGKPVSPDKPGKGGGGPATGGSGTPTDPNIGSVVFLSGFEGTNNSTSFVDESPAARTMTAVGNAKCDTSIKKFGSSAAYFDGTSDAITAAESTDWRFGSGAFTIEAFVNFDTLGNFRQICSYYTSTFNKGWILRYDQHVSPRLNFVYSTDGNNDFEITRAWTPSADTWYHVCVDRSGNTLRMYVDGVMLGAAETMTATIFNANTLMRVGAEGGTTACMLGWIDELRITKGVARYASNSGFTVPTAAYPRS